MLEAKKLKMLHVRHAYVMQDVVTSIIYNQRLKLRVSNMATSVRLKFFTCLSMYYFIFVGYKVLAGATRFFTYDLKNVGSNPPALTISFLNE
jgi:hypothetical protein